jgi:type IV pilus biogenesis protein CpaD/CtpE
MATTVTAADLNVTITESITLNGVVYGNSKTTTITSNTKAEQRIMSIAGKGESGNTYTTIIGFGSEDSASDVRSEDFKYVRITNLDNSSTLNLRLSNGTDFVYMPIEAGDSIVLMGSGIDHTVAGEGNQANTIVAFTAIAAQSNETSTAIDIEFLVVTA